jgi:acyl-homoserine lactone acylase PvdQ
VRALAIAAVGGLVLVAAGAGFAPLYRQVIDLGDLRRSRWLPPVPGQSEHPLSPHYGDQIEPWLSGQLRPMLWDRKDIEADAEATLVLQPASSGDL